MELTWDEGIQERFKLAISKMPLFQRRIAETMVTKRLFAMRTDEGLEIVSEKALVLAFFSEVPAPFKGLMKNLLKEVDIDYSKYVDEK